MSWQDDVSNAFGGFGHGTIPDATNISTASAASNSNSSSGNSYQTKRQEENLKNYLKEQKRQADRDYELKKRDLDQRKAIADREAKTAAERNAIDKWYNEQQVRLAGERLAEEGRQFNERLAFDKQTQAENLGLSQARQGYDLLNMQANLRGPQDFFQADELSRGIAAQPGTATFLNALKNNTNLAGYGAQAGVPDKANINALAARLGYTGPELVPGAGVASAGGSSNAATNLAAIRDIGAAGAHKLGAGSLEQLTDTERKLLESGLGASGFDVPTFLQQYARSRIGQGLAGVNAA